MAHPSSRTRRGLGFALGVVVVGTSACVASKSDIALLQTDIRTVRTDVARVDSAVRSSQVRLASRIDGLADSLRLVADSIDKTLRLTLRTNADALGAGRAADQRIITLEELLRVTLRQLNDMKSEMSILRESLARTEPANRGDSAAKSAEPPPEIVLTSALVQLHAGAYHAARLGLSDYLTRWPQSESAPTAMLNLADAFAGDVGPQAADSVYQLVETRYPNSDEAATALYKHARYLCTQREVSRAQELLARQIRLYPKATATDLAREFVRQCR